MSVASFESSSWTGTDCGAGSTRWRWVGLTNLVGTLGSGGVVPNMNPAGQPMSGGYGNQHVAGGYGRRTGA